MADPWEDAAKNFKPAAAAPGPDQSPAGNAKPEDWKIWQSDAGGGPKGAGPVSNAMSHAGARLAEIPGSIANAVLHPIDTVSGMYGQQKQLAGEGVDAAKSGDYPLAAARGIETLMPGVGPAIANGFKTIRSGDTSGGVGDMLGTVGPALALRGATMSPKVQAFTRGAYEAAKEPTSAHFGPFRVSVPVPAPLAGGVTGSVIGGHFGVPGLGAAIGTVAPLIRGGMRAAEGQDWIPSAPGATPNPFTAPGPRLLNRGGIVMPPTDTPDASYVRGAPAMAQPPNPARALPAAPRVFNATGEGPAPDASYVRGVPAMTHPPNPARALPAAPNIYQMPPAADTSFVRAVPGGYAKAEPGFVSPRERQVIGEPLTAPAPVNPTVPDHSAITQQYKPSRSNAKFDANGKRVWPGDKR